MKKLFTTVILILTCFSLLPSKTNTTKPNLFYHSLEATFLTLQTVDLLTTWNGNNKFLGVEQNPLVNLWIRNKPVTVVITAAVGITTLYAFRKLHKRNKTLATVGLIVLNSAVGWVVYNNNKMNRNVNAAVGII